MLSTLRSQIRETGFGERVSKKREQQKREMWMWGKWSGLAGIEDTLMGVVKDKSRNEN